VIDIIIPIYNSRERLPYLLMSIASQEVHVSFKVTLVDDCSSESYDDILHFFKNVLDIQYLRMNQNGGAGVARQYGIDNTFNDYIIFLDSDDLLYTVDSIEQLYCSIDSEYNLVCGLEYDENKGSILCNEGNVHAKIYERQFLNDYGIRFNNTRFHEDNFFNNWVLLAGANVLYIDSVVYIYCNYQNSTTRQSKSLEFERLQILLKNVQELLKKFPVTEENSERISRFVYLKYRYYNRIYMDFSSDQKAKFCEWIKKYDSNHFEFIGINDYDYLEKLIKKKYGVNL